MLHKHVKWNGTLFLHHTRQTRLELQAFIVLIYVLLTRHPWPEISHIKDGAKWQIFSNADPAHKELMHLDQEKMATILPTFSNAFHRMKTFDYFNKKKSLKYSRWGVIDNKSALTQKVAWCRTGDKPLSEPVHWRIYMSLDRCTSRWLSARLQYLHC